MRFPFVPDKSFRAGTGRDSWSWPVLLLLLTILVPSGGVIWMMRQAMKNERLAVRQRLTDLYQVQLESAQQQVLKRWQEQLAKIEAKAAEKLPSERFAKLLAEGLVDSVIVWSSDGKVQYPDRQARNTEANAELRQLETLDPTSSEWSDMANSLRDRLNRYDSQRLSAPQRRFLMRELTVQWPDVFEFTAQEGEMLAAEFLDDSDGGQPTVGLHATLIENVWSAHASDGKVTALYRTSTLLQLIDGFLADQPLPDGIVMQTLVPGESLDSVVARQSVALGPTCPGWRLAISANDHQFGINSGSERVALFAWTALALIAVTLLLTWWVVRSWWQQMQVAQLKNDLVATVSHELKTPLSSIRLLVDTLLDQDASGQQASGQQATHDPTREYLELISQENARLTRLIENFLTFSRMEEGKRDVQLQSIEAREVVTQAVDAVRERFDTELAELIVEAEQATPVRGDLDLLVTCVVNLLDNAWKYSGDTKRIVLSCTRQGERVVLAVQDNGVGLQAKATEKVFDRFYQVDQRLSRSQGGCGLGLSIVKYLVEAHGGEVKVESKTGVGSTFSILLPVDLMATGENDRR